MSALTVAQYQAQMEEDHKVLWTAAVTQTPLDFQYTMRDYLKRRLARLPYLILSTVEQGKVVRDEAEDLRSSIALCDRLITLMRCATAPGSGVIH